MIGELGQLQGVRYYGQPARDNSYTLILHPLVEETLLEGWWPPIFVHSRKVKTAKARKRKQKTIRKLVWR